MKGKVFGKTVSLAASGTSVITDSMISKATEHYVTVTGTGVVALKTKVGADTNQTTQASITGGDPSTLLSLCDVTEIEVTETGAVNTAVVTITSVR